MTDSSLSTGLFLGNRGFSSDGSRRMGHGGVRGLLPLRSNGRSRVRRLGDLLASTCVFVTSGENLPLRGCGEDMALEATSTWDVAFGSA